MTARIPVAILGATGTVGQRFILRLADHPWFEVTRLFASERSAGQPYKRAARWLQPCDMPPAVRNLPVEAATPQALAQLASQGVPLAFSALGSEEARALEPAAAAGGATVFSNAAAFRMHPAVPLIIPEVNAEHLALTIEQDWSQALPAGTRAHGRGALITNPNCSTVGLVMALAPLVQRFGLRRLHVVTLQALSGAGLVNGQPLSIGDNLIPNIPGEAEKLRTEPHKLLGELCEARHVAVHPSEDPPAPQGRLITSTPGRPPLFSDASSAPDAPAHETHIERRLEIRPALFPVSATTTRVPVSHGHTLVVSLELDQPAQAADLFGAWRNHRARPQELALPSAPAAPIHAFAEAQAPQPLLHRDLEGGMAIAVGQLERDPLFDPAAEPTAPTRSWKFVTLSHNLERGAAGGAVLNAELWCATQPDWKSRQR